MSEQGLAVGQARPRGNGKIAARRQMVEQVMQEVRVRLERAPAAELEQVLARWKQTNSEQTRAASDCISEEDTLVLALSEGQTYAPDAALRLEIEALQRAFVCREALLRGSLTAPQVARLLGTTRQTPHDRAQSLTLLAVEDRGSLRFPYWQFDANGPNGIIIGLPAVLKALDISPLGKVSWLTCPNPYLDGHTPLEALKAGYVERVVDQARAVGAGG